MGRAARGEEDGSGRDSAHAGKVAHVIAIVLAVVAVAAGAAVLALGTCGGKSHPGAANGSGAGSGASKVANVAPVVADAAVGIVDAGGSSQVELLHAVPATVRVSSTVNNPKILAKHIADRDMNTAWNSVTGQLVGAWIEVSVDDAQIETVKMTVGHTGHGPKGEDYFTMNPRIAEVAITDDGKPLGTFPLDVSKRELQSIDVKPKGVLRITITKIEPGSKKNWREAAVSELEVWGTPAAGWVKPSEPMDPFVEVDGEPESAPDPCAGIDDARTAFGDPHRLDTNGPGGDDHAYPPTCEDLPMPANSSTLPAPWSSVATGCPVNDEIYGPKDCIIAFRSGNRTAQIEVSSSMAHDDIKIVSLEEMDVIAGGPNELVVKVERREQIFTFVCRTSPLACAGPLDAPMDMAVNLRKAAASATFDSLAWAKAD